MDFSYDDEQLALRDAVRALLGTSYSDFEQRRRTVAEDPGFDEELWGRLAEMGVLGLPFPEEYGGMGAGPVEVAIVAQELGRVLAPEPFLTSVVLAGAVVAATGTEEQRAAVLGGVASGETLLAFAHAEPRTRWATAASSVQATAGDAGWMLSGVKEPVPHGARADVLVVSALLESGETGLFVAAGDASGLSRDGYPTHDGGRAARVEFADTPAEPLGAGGDAAVAIDRIHTISRIVACHQALGAMEVSLDATTTYLTSRKQFGVTLNTFQSLSFRASDMYVSLELARSLATWATMVLADNPAGAGAAASRAALQVSRSGRHIGQEAIQLHGGIGMTAEYSIGSYTSHLTALDHLLGDGDFHLARLSADVGTYDEVDPIP